MPTASDAGAPAILVVLGADEKESTLSHLDAVSLVQAERTCQELLHVVRGSARVWHQVALQRVLCPLRMLDAEKRTDWRFWRGVCVSTLQPTAVVSLLDEGLGLCSATSSCQGAFFVGNNVLLDTEDDCWSSGPIVDGVRARESLSFHTLLESSPTADDVQYLGTLISEVRLRPYQSQMFRMGWGRPIFAPDEASVAFECEGVTYDTQRQPIAPTAEYQVIATFDPPLLISPGMLPGYGKMTLTLYGAAAQGEPEPEPATAASSVASSIADFLARSPLGVPPVDDSQPAPQPTASACYMRLARVCCLGRQIRCVSMDPVALR